MDGLRRKVESVKMMWESETTQRGLENRMREKAIRFATKAHEGQVRKGTNRPFILHPLEVGEIVASMTDDEEVISAAILHDTIEDCKEITAEIISREFSPRVANLVTQESEDKTKTWLERKSRTIEELKTASWEIQMIALGDKLSNMRDIDRDYKICGEELWNRFNMKDKHMIGWYYKNVCTSLEPTMKTMEPFVEYSTLIERNFEEELAIKN